MHAIILATGCEDIPLFHSISASHRVFFMEPKRSMSAMSEVFSVAAPSDTTSVEATKIAGQIELWSGSSRYKLPLRPWKIQNLISPSQRKDAFKSWIKARVRSLSTVIMGGGQEERSYKDWVCRRMGEPAYRELYEGYAKKRWGCSGEELSSGLARRVHFQNGSTDPFRYDWNGNVQLDERHYLWSNRPQGISLKDGKVFQIQFADESVELEGLLYSSLPIGMLLSLLGDAVPKSIQVDANHIQYKHFHAWSLEGDFSASPNIIHFLDNDDPRIFFIKQSDQRALLRVTSSDADSSSLRDWNARIIENFTLKDWEPVWTSQAHFRYRRVAQYLEDIGIRLMGKRGYFSHDSQWESGQLAQSQPELPIAEFLRLHVEPPIKQDDINARISRWIVV